MKTGTQLQDLHNQRASVGPSFRSGLHPQKNEHRSVARRPSPNEAHLPTPAFQVLC